MPLCAHPTVPNLSCLLLPPPSRLPLPFSLPPSLPPTLPPSSPPPGSFPQELSDSELQVQQLRLKVKHLEEEVQSQDDLLSGIREQALTSAEALRTAADIKKVRGLIEERGGEGRQ